MKPLSVGTRLFLSIMAIFVALVIVFLAYLRFDESLSSTIRNDAIFLWFAIALAVVGTWALCGADIALCRWS